MANERIDVTSVFIFGRIMILSRFQRGAIISKELYIVTNFSY